MRIVVAFILACLPLLASGLQEQVLHTQVRVRTQTAGGSGTVIYAEKDGGFFSTYVITCHHVIEDALKVEEEWDSLLSKDKKVEHRQPVTVQLFQWAAVPHGKSPLTAGAEANIVAYDAKHDMALLHLRLADRPPVAKMLPLAQKEKIQIGAPTVAAGCALGHTTVLTKGIITGLGDVIDYKDYVLSTAQIIFGNSGGGLYLDLGGEYYFIGVPSRVAMSGWSSAVTHMGYSSPVWRVYQFLEEEMFDFLIPGSAKTEAQCAEARDAKRALEEKKLRLE
jgi:S1-C subfamily serine protease